MTGTRTDRTLVLSLGDWLTVLLLGGAGFLVGGLMGLVVALLGIAATARRGGAEAARAAFLLLVLAGLATVVEAVPTHSGIAIDFAARRPVAARAAEAAGVLAMVGLVGFAYTERSAFAAVALPVPKRWVLAPTLARLRAVVPYAAAAAVAVAVRAVALPPTLPPGYGPEVVGLRSGGGFTTALRPPLATVVAAFAPGPTRAALLVVSLLTVLAVVRLADRLARPPVPLLAGLVAAVLPSLWGQQLPEALGALAVTTALVVLWPPALDVRRAALGGLALAGAVLARPEALVAVPVTAAWILVHRGRKGLPHLAVALVTGSLAFAPWQLWVQRSFGSWLPTTSLGPTLAGSTVEEVLSGGAMGSFRSTSFSRAGGDEGARDREARAEALKRSLRPRLPLVVTARVLRGWDLWPGQAAERARRHLPFPGGQPGIAVEVVTAALAGWGAWRLRRSWRAWLPVYALPALFTLVSAGTFGDRGLKYLAAPSLAMTSGTTLALLGRGASGPPGTVATWGRRRRGVRSTPGAPAVVVGLAVLVGVVVTTTPASERRAGRESARPSTTAASPPAAPPLPTTTTAAPLRPAAEVAVVPLNASGVVGATRGPTEAMRRAGYRVARPGPSPPRQPSSSVYWKVGYKNEARAVATALGLPAAATQPWPDPPPVPGLEGAHVVVVVGEDLAR